MLAAEYDEVLLRPGDMLFIPRHYWHYCTAVASPTVKSLLQSHTVNVESPDIEVDTSDCFSWSVNFWWGKRIIKE